MATYSTNGCSVGNTQILLNNVSGPGVNTITVHNLPLPIQGTLSGTSAHIFLNSTAFNGFKYFIQHNPVTTVHFTPMPIIPAPFTWP